MNDMLKQEMAMITQEVLDGLLKRSNESISSVRPEGVNVDLLEKIRTADYEVLKSIIGKEFAEKLKSLSDVIDFSHPALPSSLVNGLSADNIFAKTLSELLVVATSTKDQALPHLSQLIQDTLIKGKEYRESFNAIVKPPIRCIGDAKQRESARSGKKMKSIDLKEWQKTGTKTWNNYPSTFRIFVRQSDYRQRELSASSARATKFETIGASSMASSMAKAIEQMNKFVNETYIGFYKLKMVDASVVLAKVHNATFHTTSNELGMITMPRKMFDEHKFWLDGEVTFPVSKDHRKAATGKKAKVMVKSFIVPDYYTFSPRSYPIHEFVAKRPAHIDAAINACEQHPDLDNKVAYDQYWVVVPGLELTQETFFFGNSWVLRQGDTCERFDTQEELQVVLDTALTDAGVLHPVLLGEKDGKCYFVALW